MRRLSSFRRGWLKGLLLLIAAALATLPVLAAIPSTAWFERAARGLNAQAFGDAPEFSDRLAASLWHLGGLQGLAIPAWLGAWALWSVAFFALALVLRGLRTRISDRAFHRLSSAAVLFFVGMALAGIARSVLSWRNPARDPRLWLPTSEAGLLADHRAITFVSPSAMVPATLAGIASVMPRADAESAMKTVSGWRASLRDIGWNAVFLAGSETEISPLLEHLMVAPDWRLVSVEPTGWVFLRESGPDVPLSKPEAVQLGNARKTALALAALSARFEAMRAIPSAREAIERALTLDPGSWAVRVQAASFAASRKRWQDVIEQSREALRLNARSPQARMLLALGLLESGNIREAAEAAESATQAAPRDPSTHLLLARAHRVAHDFPSEITTLKHLLALLENLHQPTATTLTYLGQAYAEIGNAQASKKSFREALASGQLTPTDARSVQEALKTIESRSNYQTVGSDPTP